MIVVCVRACGVCVLCGCLIARSPDCVSECMRGVCVLCVRDVCVC